MEERERKLWKLHLKVSRLTINLIKEQQRLTITLNQLFLSGSLSEDGQSELSHRIDLTKMAICDVKEKDFLIIDKLIEINLPKIKNYKLYLAN